MSGFRRVGNLYVPHAMEVGGRRLRGVAPNLRVEVFNSERETGIALGLLLKGRVDVAAMRNEPIQIGLATGRSPIHAYEVLRGDDWSHVTTWNLDEYYPMKRDDPQSYHRFMREKLFDHLRIPDTSTNIPSGDPGIDPNVEAARYEAALRSAGPIAVQVVGMGRVGHLGFNERGSAFDSPTRLVDLHPETIEDAKPDFIGREQPTKAITMGLGTLLSAREIALIVTGAKKAETVAKALLDPVTRDVPASVLQQHPNVAVFLDRDAASVLEHRLRQRRR